MKNRYGNRSSQTETGCDRTRAYQSWGLQQSHVPSCQRTTLAVLARIHRFIQVKDGVRTAEGCEGVTGAIIRACIRVGGRPGGHAGALGGAVTLRWARERKLSDQRTEEKPLAGPGGASLQGICGCALTARSVQTGAYVRRVEWLGAGLGRTSLATASSVADAYRRAERVSRPAREKNRRRRVLVVRSARPDRSALSSGKPGYAPSPASPARRRWRRSGRTEDDSTPRRTSGLEWRSRPRHGGGGRPPAPGFPRPGR